MNFLIALFLLLAAGLLANQACKFWSLLLGGVFASLATLVLFAPELPLLLQFVYQGISALLVVKTSYFPLRGRVLYKVVAWYYLLNLLLAGVLIVFLLQSKTTYHGAQTNNLSIYFYISPTLLIGCVIGVYLVLKLFLFCFAAPQTTATPQNIVVQLQGERLTAQAFYDTGFAMQDPFSNRKILMLCFPAVKEQLSDTLRNAIENAFLCMQVQQAAAVQKHQPAFTKPSKEATEQQSEATSPQERQAPYAQRNTAQANQETTAKPNVPIRYLPCKTVTGAQLLPAICADCAYHANTPNLKREQILVVFCKENSFCNTSTALFGTDLAEVLIQSQQTDTRTGVSP